MATGRDDFVIAIRSAFFKKKEGRGGVDLFRFWWYLPPL